MKPPIIPIILSGGSGVRLWPLSRASRPKQFLRIGGRHTLIQETLLRCSDKIFDQKPIILAGEIHRFLVAEEIRQLGISADIVLEPMRRDSCAAIAAGCLVALGRSPDAMVLVLAADHLIADKSKFVEAVERCSEDADQGFLTTFGVRPTAPEIGFGYIKPGALLREGGSHRIERFVEKPDAELARQYIEQGFLWNSGNFLFRADSFLNELKIYASDVFVAVEKAVNDAELDSDFIRLDSNAFAQSQQISVDYAVMEKTHRAAIYEVEYDWSDVGSWEAVYDILPKDDYGNAIAGKVEVVDGANNLVFSTDKLIALYGINDSVVVSVADAVLVTKRQRSNRLKNLVAELKARNIQEWE